LLFGCAMKGHRCKEGCEEEFHVLGPTLKAGRPGSSRKGCSDPTRFRAPPQARSACLQPGIGLAGLLGGRCIKARSPLALPLQPRTPGFPHAFLPKAPTEQNLRPGGAAKGSRSSCKLAFTRRLPGHAGTLAAQQEDFLVIRK
jgi:hypothetical protein